MKTSKLLALASLLTLATLARGQKAPEVGYVFPPGGKPGTTIDVRLGGYDWTPDMEFFTLDKGVKLSPAGTPGPILIPGPPYWFGAKGRLPSLPLPREVPAKFTIPAATPAGPIYWQAANANGCTATGVFIVGTGTEVVEDEKSKEPQLLATLPVTVSGRLLKNEEVDRYRFIATKDGPITCELLARRLGAKFMGIVEVRDSKDQMVADVAGTNGADPSLTFVAKGGAEYTVRIHDIDFGGDRSHVYRLTVTPGPRILGAIPIGGKRGETREVEFVGIGVASGAAKLESLKRSVTFPATGSAFDYRLETPFGTTPPFQLLLGDLPESVAFPRHDKKTEKLTLPGAVTGVLDQLDAKDSYFCTWKKGEVWSLALQARKIGSPLDVSLAILGPDGKELIRNDDLPETTDAGLDFAVPADGTYQVVVSDMAGKSGSRAAIYRLIGKQATPDFTLQIPIQRVSVPLGGKFDLAVKAVRVGGFKGPIALTVRGLPAGVSVPPNLSIPADKNDLIVPLQAAADSSPAAGVVNVDGTATLPSGAVTRSALARTTANLAPRGPEENQLSALLVASIMKPKFKGRPVDQDTGRKVHRGSTFPAEVIVERLDGFAGEITLQMAAQQSYQVHGITGGDVIVPPGVSRTIYPCYMPEWLETIRTSRMGMIAVARVPDPKGKVRYLVNGMEGFITMTMEGALLKVSAEDQELVVPEGKPFDVHLKVARLVKLAEQVTLELRLPEELAGKLDAKPMPLAGKAEKAVFRVNPAAGLKGTHTFTIRATAMQEGKYPVISETAVTVEFVPAAPVPTKGK